MSKKKPSKENDNKPQEQPEATPQEQAAAAEKKQEDSLPLNPYPGLRPFKIEESHLFFGREGQTDEVLQKMGEHHFVGIIGPSGSGKSSFVYCGVLPILFGGFLAKSGPNWDVIVMRPGSSPIENLAEALLAKDPKYQNETPEDYEVRKTILTTLLRSDSGGLIEAIRQIKKETHLNYLILVDQFEELFRYRSGQEDAHAVDDTLTFIGLLMEAVNHDDAAYYVSITMRSDFIGECAQYPELTRKINDSHYLIPQLTREQKRAAIEGPASVGHGAVAPTMVQRLLNDMGDNPDQLPILQHALMRTWDFWTRNHEAGEPVDLKHYEAIGTMEEALSLHADEAYNELNEKQQGIAQVLFKAITEKRGVYGIRRPTPLKDIAAIAGCKSKEVAEVVVVFRRPGRSFLTPGHGVKLNPESMIDISHESLMRIWVRLKNWVDEEAEAVNMYLRLSEAAEKYQVGQAGLWRPPDLQLALNWQVKHRPTLIWGERYNSAFERSMSFLEYSKKEYDNEQRVKELQMKRKRQFQRTVTALISLALVVSIAFGLFANYQRTQADEAKVEADIQRDSAQYNLQLAEIAQQEALDSAEAARVARIEAIEAQIVAEINADSAVAAQQRAELQRLRAEQQKDIADRKTVEADTARNQAERDRERAIISESEATIQSYQNLALKLGSKATQNIPDPQLRGLMARHAYNFNTEYEGNPHDADIFAGLYAALGEEGFNDPSTHPLPGHAKEIYAIKYSQEANATFTGGTRGQIIKWQRGPDGALISTVLVKARSTTVTASISDIEVVNDGQQIVVAGDFMNTPNQLSRYLEVYNVSDGSEFRKINGVNNQSFALTYSDSRDQVYFIDNSGKSVKRASVSSGNVFSFANYEEDTLNDISISADENRIAGVAGDGKLIFWDAEDGSIIEMVDGETGESLTRVKYSPDGKHLVYGDQEGTLVLIDANSNELIKSFTDHTAKIDGIDFNYLPSNESTFMVSASFDKSSKIWNLVRPNDPPISYGENNFALSVAFTHDNKSILVGSLRGILHEYPTEATGMAERLCDLITRPMNDIEWEAFVGPTVPREEHCEDQITSSTSDQQ